MKYQAKSTSKFVPNNPVTRHAKSTSKFVPNNSGGAGNQPKEGPVSTTLTHMSAVKWRTGGGQQRAHVIRRKWQSFSQHV